MGGEGSAGGTEVAGSASVSVTKDILGWGLRGLLQNCCCGQEVAQAGSQAARAQPPHG